MDDLIAWVVLWLLAAVVAFDAILSDAGEVTSGRQYAVIVVCALLWPLSGLLVLLDLAARWRSRRAW